MRALHRESERGAFHCTSAPTFAHPVTARRRTQVVSNGHKFLQILVTAAAAAAAAAEALCI